MDFQESCNLSDWLGTFWVITQKQEFFQKQDLRWQVKDDKNQNLKIYQNHNIALTTFTQEAGSRFRATPVDTKNCPFYQRCGKDPVQI